MKICPKCNSEHNKEGKFCSRKCANSRGPRTEDFKEKVRKKLLGHNHTSKESILKSIRSKGQTPIFDKPDTTCVMCGNITHTKYRKTCSDECYTILLRINSQINIKCGGQKQTHKSMKTNINGKSYILESSYESIVADSLNENGIEWIRPEPFFYKDGKGNTRRYYPDFFLPEYNLYLDPKNDYLIKTDIDKINRTAHENNIRIFILGKNHLSWSAYKCLVEDDGTAPPSCVCNTQVLLLN